VILLEALAQEPGAGPGLAAVIGLVLLVIGVLANGVTALGLLRCRDATSRVHVMSIGAVAALLPCLLGAALVIGDAAAVARALVGAVIGLLAAPFLGQALLVRAVADRELVDPRQLSITKDLIEAAGDRRPE
jgi:multisubunit Na+/H+ antiporter MnhG subunit